MPIFVVFLINANFLSALPYSLYYCKVMIVRYSFFPD